MQIIKKTLCIGAIFFSAIVYCPAQSASIEQLQNEFLKAKEDSIKLFILMRISDAYENSNLDSMLFYAKEQYLFSIKHNAAISAQIQLNALKHLAYSFWETGNYGDAKENYFKALKNAELISDSITIAGIYNGIGIVNRNEGNFREAITYFSKGEEFSKSKSRSAEYWAAITDKGKSYEQLNILDSAFIYAQQSIAMQEYRKMHNLPISGGVYSNMAIVYSKLGQNELAVTFFNMAINECRTQQYNRLLARVYYEYAEHLDRNELPYQAIFFAGNALALDQQYGFLVQQLSASRLLSKLYLDRYDTGNAFKYQQLMVFTKDSIFSREKISRSQNLEFEEKLREQEVAATKLLLEEERRQNIEYALIGLGLVIFIILFLVLSQSIITNSATIRFLGVVALLIVFEFFNLWMHPFLENITHHSTLLMLLLLVCIGALLTPAHHKLEKWAIDKLVEKNKKIRLNAAKKIIAQLDN